MPVVEDEVPQWKKELIQKKQMWKRSGGWSVPPVSPSKSALKLRPPDLDKGLDPPASHMEPTRPKSDHLDRVDSNNNNGTMENHFGSVENINCFGSVSELKTKFQPSDDDDVFAPLTKARSEENILDRPVVLDARRRSSTSSQLSFHRNETVTPKKNVKTVPKMEAFFKKYRKTTRKPIVVETEVDSPKRSVTGTPRRSRSDTVYFVDMNQNELPPPNTVRQTVKVFEEPVKSSQKSTKPDFDEMTSPSDVGDVPPDASPRARDVVQKFEEKIKSNSRDPQVPPKPPRASRPTGAGAVSHNGAVKPLMAPKPAILVSTSEPQKKVKHVSFNTDAENGHVLNLMVQNDGATDLSSTRDDLKTVTINTNQSIIIKTV